LAGGSDTKNNGIALCVLHRKLFDRGAISISEKSIVLVYHTLKRSIQKILYRLPNFIDLSKFDPDDLLEDC